MKRSLAFLGGATERGEQGAGDGTRSTRCRPRNEENDVWSHGTRRTRCRLHCTFVIQWNQVDRIKIKPIVSYMET